MTNERVEVVAKLPPGEDNQDLADRLMNIDGLDAKVTKSGMLVVTLGLHTDYQQEDGLRIFRIPSALSDRRKSMTLTLNAWEHGGKVRNKEEATIVCGYAGSKLYPFYIRKGECCFSVPQSLVTISVAEKRATISQHSVVRDGMLAKLTTQKPFVDHPIRELKKSDLEMYLPAARAALDKSECEHCQDLHWVANGF